MKATTVFLLMAMVALWPSASAHAQTDAPKAERFVWLPPGSTWTVNLKLSGSLGSGTQEVTAKSLGEVDWDGRRVLAYESRGGTLRNYFDAQGRLLGSARDGKPTQTYRPYEGLYEWPLLVGKSWTSELQVTYHERNETIDDKVVFTVEAFEEITIPAGAFKTFRISRISPNFRYLSWYEPTLGLEVKIDFERNATHTLGVGTYQMEMISYTIKN
jgi:hypothetical protein